MVKGITATVSFFVSLHAAQTHSQAHWACIIHEIVGDESQRPGSPPELLTYAATPLTHNVRQILS